MSFDEDADKLDYNELPIVYSCSGCSNIAQLANNIAVKMDREGVAEMSCIAGVGGHVKPLVKKAKSGRPVIAIDGCILHCAKACLENEGVKPDIHYTLTEFGLKKTYHTEYSNDTVEEIYSHIVSEVDTKIETTA